MGEGGVFSLAGDEADELGHAFLHCFLRIFGDLSVVRQRFLHNPADICDGEESVLLPNAAPLIPFLKVSHDWGAALGATKPGLRCDRKSRFRWGGTHCARCGTSRYRNKSDVSEKSVSSSSKIGLDQNRLRFALAQP